MYKTLCREPAKQTPNYSVFEMQVDCLFVEGYLILKHHGAYRGRPSPFPAGLATLSGEPQRIHCFCPGRM
jgi:hypothetical protein